MTNNGKDDERDNNLSKMLLACVLYEKHCQDWKFCGITKIRYSHHTTLHITCQTSWYLQRIHINICKSTTLLICSTVIPTVFTFLVFIHQRSCFNWQLNLREANYSADTKLQVAAMTIDYKSMTTTITPTKCVL